MKYKYIRYTTIVSLSLICVLLLLATGCKRPMADSIVGRWEEQGIQGQFIEFFHDHTFLMNVVKDNQQFSGRWVNVGEGRIKAEVSILGTTVLLMFEDIKISGDTLTMTLDGATSNFTRWK